MNLKIYALVSSPPRIVRAQATRAWMDQFPARHPYRCLPLDIANAYGWDILSPYTFTVTWSGGPRASDLLFQIDGDPTALSQFVNGAFTHGIVTFHTSYLIRTDPGWHLAVTGPPNEAKDGIVPLTGIIESDWLPYTFTMNWQLTRPGTVRFEAGEPFCRVFPVRAGLFEGVEPELLALDQDPDLKAQYQLWRAKREEFMERYRGRDPATIKQGWQRFYFQGKYADGTEAEVDHISKLRVAEPRDLRDQAQVEDRPEGPAPSRPGKVDPPPE